MASSIHVRSNSLPSRSHPAAVIVEDHLCRLGLADKTCSSASSISRNLASLGDLHESLQNLIQLPSIQQELSLEPSNKWANGILDGSVRLLDVCSTAKDIMLQMKQSVIELESALRRNRGKESSVANEINAYAISGKKVNKMIAKCIRNLKISEKKSSMALEGKFLSIQTMLDESEMISFSILKSLLVYLSGNADGSKQRGWSFINKFAQSKRVHCDMEELRALEITIQELAELLETIFKSLIKRRVSLLNILDH